MLERMSVYQVDFSTDVQVHTEPVDGVDKAFKDIQEGVNNPVLCVRQYPFRSGVR